VVGYRFLSFARYVRSDRGAPKDTVLVLFSLDCVTHSWFVAPTKVLVWHDLALAGLAVDALGCVPVVGFVLNSEDGVNSVLNTLTEIFGLVSHVCVCGLDILNCFLNDNCFREGASTFLALNSNL